MIDRVLSWDPPPHSTWNCFAETKKQHPRLINRDVAGFWCTSTAMHNHHPRQEMDRLVAELSAIS